MQRIFIIAIAFAVFIAGVAAADRFVPAKGSLIRIEGTSSLHDWKMEGTAIEGSITTPPLDRWKDDASNVAIAIPVTSIRSEHAKMDKLMADALKAGTHPTVKYALTTATLTESGTTIRLETRGKLTIAGVTRDVAMQVHGVREPAGTYVLTGQLPIRMSDYGIKPPTAMMGTIKTGNEVKVTFRWVVRAAQN